MVARPSTRAPRGARLYHAWRGATRVTWWWRGKWRGIGLPSWELFSFTGPVPALVRRSKERAMPVRPDAPTAGSPAPGAKAGGWGASMPFLTEWIISSTWDDGAVRGAVQLQIRREGSVIRATLKIADQGGLKVSAIEESPLDALLALDMLLAASECPWEVDPYPLQAAVRRKK